MARKPRTTPVSPARRAATITLARQLRHGDAMPPLGVDTKGLKDRDARLAVAIHRTALQRLITCRWLIRRSLDRKAHRIENAVEAVLITGVAQIVFMEHQPAHAVVDECVEFAKKSGPGASTLVNAVLRKVAALVAERRAEGGWRASPWELPWGDGSVRLAEPILPPVKEVANSLSVATSHPAGLVEAWVSRFGRERATEILLHDLVEPPTIVSCPAGVEMDPAVIGPHEQAGFGVAIGGREDLTAFLKANPGCRVQDPASSAAVKSTAGLGVKLIVDFCAGLGTKTRQLAELHPEARVVASDPDPVRFEELGRVFRDHPRVTVVGQDEIADYTGGADLVVLDVPCSNTGVLARRLEARYRYGEESLASVTGLQRTILEAAGGLLRGEGSAWLLYSTCSIEPSENEEQAAWAAARWGMRVEKRETILPAGTGASYHDGSFHALLGRP